MGLLNPLREFTVKCGWSLSLHDIYVYKSCLIDDEGYMIDDD